METNIQELTVSELLNLMEKDMTRIWTNNNKKKSTLELRITKKNDKPGYQATKRSQFSYFFFNVFKSRHYFLERIFHLNIVFLALIQHSLEKTPGFNSLETEFSEPMVSPNFGLSLDIKLICIYIFKLYNTFSKLCIK